MSTKFCSVVWLTFVATIIANCVTSSPQKLTFYEDINCLTTRRSEILLDTRTGLDTSWITNASSLQVIGMWKLNVKKLNSTGNGFEDDLLVVNYRTQPPNGRCIDKSNWTNIDWPNFRFYNAERLGPSADMENSGIQLYTDELFSGASYRVTGDMAAVGSAPANMSSYIHFSNEAWTVYSEKNFVGDKIFIYPAFTVAPNGTFLPSPKDSYSFKNDPNNVILVGSIKKGEHRGNVGGSAINLQIVTPLLISLVAFTSSVNVV